MTEDQQREVFAALVTAQDEGQSVPESRRAVAARFNIEVEDVEQAEADGLKKQWPPL